jgi:PAS domain S-box-containing protein
MTASTYPSGLLPESLLAMAIDTVDACVAIMSGPELRYTFVNKAYQAISPGVPMLGRRYREVFAEAAGAGAEERLIDVLTTGRPWRIDRYMAPIASDPGALWEGEATRAQAAGQHGSPCVIVSIRNVTESVHVAQALSASEASLRHANARLQKTIDSITDGLLVFDSEWRYTYVSARAGEIIGLEPESLIGGCVWELFPHAIGTRFYDDYHRAMATGEPASFEEYYPHPLNMWLECRCYPSADELTVYFRDVSERHRADAALRENTALLRAISDTSADIIFAKDDRGRMRFANPAALAMIGKPLEQVLGRTDAEFLADQEAAQIIMENDRRIMDTGVANEIEEPVRASNGEEKTWLSLKIPYRDENRRVIGLLGIARDITERKRMEQKLREESHRKDEFLAMLAHELRNPLAPITTAAQLLALFAADEQRVRQAAQVIARQAAHMVGLVDDLLDVSRVTRGLIVLQKDEVDIKSVTADAVEQARPLIESRKHELITRMTSAHVMVHGDRTRLVQAIANLLNNAAKYTPSGGHITLALEADEAQVRLRVTDDGAGISSELLPRVFELFIQGERTPDRTQGGLGLGLALVKSVIGMHGGTVDAHSGGAGMGSMFTIALPRLAEDQEAAALQSPPARHKLSGQAARIMIVDDNIDAARSLAHLLEAFGHAVIVKSNAFEALEAAMEARPEVFILDIGLPGMDGYALARRLRAQAGFAGSTLVALTGYGQASDRDCAMDAGFDHHFVKPVTIDRLIGILAA